MSDQRIPMTREGYDVLKGEIGQLEAQLIEITKRVATAREMGDLSENAEYHAAREDQGMQQAKIDLVRHKLAHAMIIDPNQLPKGVVEETFELVGPGEDDPDKNRILTTSPIGQGLVGKKKGDIAEIQVPSGMLKFKILEIA